ncbi:hypothetical protein BO94DRAFT_547355 [Aspergillus sclerotioniger CBS 115572]|uniref:Uncharacterized protein n=1 Tax=Aspergillus sclerotioniger CBS 115572 TaxID=1450535 RepID=A0A317WD63_9EURO|nr:hypothetical protein BO94DRAFT_547355 [Aspergillus sclerotioniger CBS 115572]PWY83691.1 hypothetical protein BO94DRAFT_547355 [Aspergillus sclerotioniger CBS 115572]
MRNLCTVDMRVILDQIEFYHGPSLQRPSTSAKKVSTGHATAHAPRTFHRYSPTGSGFCQRPCEASLGQAPPLTGTTHEWNMFDIAIDNVYGSTWPQITKGIEPAATTNMPTARDMLLDGRSSTLADSVSLRHSTRVTCPAGADYLDRIPPDMRENDLAEMETSRLSCVPCVTAPVPAPEQANTAFSNIFAVGDSQQRSVKRKLSITGSSHSDSMHHWGDEKDTEPSQTAELGGIPCYRENDAPKRAKDSNTAENKSASSGPPTVRSTPEYSGARMALSSDKPVI